MCIYTDNNEAGHIYIRLCIDFINSLITTQEFELTRLTWTIITPLDIILRVRSI
jgi:hypothetical protein